MNKSRGIVGQLMSVESFPDRVGGDSEEGEAILDATTGDFIWMRADDKNDTSATSGNYPEERAWWECAWCHTIQSKSQRRCLRCCRMRGHKPLIVTGM